MQARFVFLFALLIVACSSVRDASSSPHGGARRGSGVMISDQRQSIVEYAMSLVGTRYRYGGCAPNQGFDCSGFTSFVMGKHGYALPRTSGGQSVQGRVVDTQKAQPGDLIFFGRGRNVDHVAIVVKSSRNRLEIVHSSSSSGVLVEDALRSPYWKKRVMYAVDISSL